MSPTDPPTPPPDDPLGEPEPPDAVPGDQPTGDQPTGDRRATNRRATNRRATNRRATNRRAINRRAMSPRAISRAATTSISASRPGRARAPTTPVRPRRMVPMANRQPSSTAPTTDSRRRRPSTPAPPSGAARGVAAALLDAPRRRGALPCRDRRCDRIARVARRRQQRDNAHDGAPRRVHPGIQWDDHDQHRSPAHHDDAGTGVRGGHHHSFDRHRAGDEHHRGTGDHAAHDDGAGDRR